MAEKQPKQAFRKKFSALRNRKTVKTYVIPLAAMTAASIVTVIFTVLCMANFRSGFLAEHATVFTSLLLGLEVVYIIAMAVCFARSYCTVYKLLLTGIVLAAAILLGLYIMQVTGAIEYIDSVEELRAIIESVGSWWAPVLFILLQILQVCLLPIPGILTVGAGVLVFEPWLACLYSYIGILIGSMISFWIGRVLGYRVAAWIAGKDTLDRWLQKIKGRDRMLLTAMFILPLFPDDVLCIVSGLTIMTWRYFIIMQLIARAISVISTVFSLNGDIIPYDQLWGIIVWICIGIAIIVLFVLIWKKGEAFERWFLSLFKIKEKGGIDIRECMPNNSQTTANNTTAGSPEGEDKKPEGAESGNKNARAQCHDQNNCRDLNSTE